MNDTHYGDRYACFAYSCQESELLLGILLTLLPCFRPFVVMTAHLIKSRST